MSYTTLEVALDHGRVVPLGGDKLPEHGRALLTLLPGEASAEPAARHSLAEARPSSVGKLLREYPGPEDDTLGEMTSERA
jgi:hypothetical protein